MANKNLSKAKSSKNDEFYTQMDDIFREVDAYLEFDPDVFRGKKVLCPCDDPYESNFFKYFALRFNGLGLKKLIATCYVGSPIANTQLSLFDDEPVENKTTKNPHKIEIEEITDTRDDGSYDLLNIQSLLKNKKNVLTRLKGDGDFRSEEVTKLRNEADIIVTNPPFSLFREFLAWIVEANKQFLIIGNMNAITYKEVFPLFKENKMWFGKGFKSGDAYFSTPLAQNYGEGVYDSETGLVKFRNCCWFTNLDHDLRHIPLPCMTMADALRYHRHKELKGKKSYDKYDNYDAIEIPYTDMIPSDHDGVMGVPISFLEKYCPEQFEIIGNEYDLNIDKGRGYINGRRIYSRVFIKPSNTTIGHIAPPNFQIDCGNCTAMPM